MSEINDKTTNRGRPRSGTAESHGKIMDAVYKLLQTRSARDLTMEAIAKEAGVGKPTLYKWWPTKAALILAMFHERIARETEKPKAGTAEQTIRFMVRKSIGHFNGLFGKVMADLIAEGQSERTHHQHITCARSSPACATREESAWP